MTPNAPTRTRPPDRSRAGPPVDLSNALAGHGADRRRRTLDTLKILVGGDDDTAAKDPPVHTPPPGPDELRMANVISGAVHDRAARPKQCRDQWPPRAGLPVPRSSAANACPNILVQGEAVSNVPAHVLRWWASSRHASVVIDIDGRYAGIDLPAGRGQHVDIALVSQHRLRETLRGPHGLCLLDFSHVPAADRSTTLTRVLSVVASHREDTDHPHWLMIDDAETVLSDPGIPPHVLDLSQRGHCLVMRWTEGLPDALAASIDIVVGSARWAGGRDLPLRGDHQDPIPADARQVIAAARGASRGPGGRPRDADDPRPDRAPERPFVDKPDGRGTVVGVGRFPRVGDQASAVLGVRRGRPFMAWNGSIGMTPNPDTYPALSPANDPNGDDDCLQPEPCQSRPVTRWEAIQAYVRAWSQPDEAAIGAALQHCWTAHSTHVSPITDQVTGVGGLTRLILDFPIMFPDARFRVTTPPEVHHDVARLAWQLESTARIRMAGHDYGYTAAGLDYLEFCPHNRIRRVVTFFGPLGSRPDGDSISRAHRTTAEGLRRRSATMSAAGSQAPAGT